MTPTGQLSARRQFLIDSYFLLTISLAIFAIAPLFYPGYFQTHSGYTPLWSINRLREGVTDLSRLPFLVPFNPWRSGGLLPYYLAAILPLSSLTALKLVSGLGILAGCSGLYLWLKSWLGSQGACVAALVYTYAPFTIATLYVRGAWSEAFFWGLLPWALLAATYLVARPAISLMVIALTFWLALGLSQLGLSVWAYLFLIIMLLIFHRPQALRPLIGAGGGLILALWLTLPRLNGELQPAPFNFAAHLVYPAQLLSSFWGYGLSRAGWDDGLSLSLGLAALGLSILTFIIWRGGPDRRPWFFAGIAIFATIISTPLGGPIWRTPGLDQLLTYPWQLLGFAALGLAVMAGIGFWLDERLRQLPIFAAIVIFILLPAYPNLEPAYITSAPPETPEAIYGQNEIVLLSHQFLIENPAAAGSPNLPEDELFLPLTPQTELKPGGEFSLAVRWQALLPISQNYKVFAHLADSQGNILQQVDVYPQEGARPTHSWLPGEIIADSYTFTLPGETAWPAQVWLGFYDEASLIRLPALGDNEGRAILNVR